MSSSEAKPAMNQDQFVNPRGRRICTYHLLPAEPPKAVVVLSHGYAHYSAGFSKHFLQWPAQHGIALYSMDHEGHGHSEGLKAYVKSYNNLVADFGFYVSSVAAKHPGLPIFVMGESMGGAIVLSSTMEGGPLHGLVRGAILVAPMCKIADSLKPPDWQISILKGMAKLGPTWPIAPVPDVLSLCFKDPAKFQEAQRDPISYHGKPRLRTALEMYYATLRIAESTSKVTVPILIVHGGGDLVTDPAFSKELHDKAASTDKTCKLYDGMYHAIFDEPDNAGQQVLNDISAWLQARVPVAASVTTFSV